MLKVYPYQQLAHHDYGWLDARYHFSFARYWNPERVHFGVLRVINDDRVAAGKGFDTHPHENMEIITYVRSGAITHRDSMGHTGRTNAGDVQVMSAGSGITHSEYNHEAVDTTLYQIWIIPSRQNVAPRWESRAFPKQLVTDQLPLLVSGQPEHSDSGALFMHQDAAIYGGRIQAGLTVTQTIKHQAYVLASAGKFQIDGNLVKVGDGVEITDLKEFKITAVEDSEVLVIDIPSTNLPG